MADIKDMTFVTTTSASALTAISTISSSTALNAVAVKAGTHGQVVSFIWSVADLIRDSFRRGHYQDVILPFTVLRRLDSVLSPTRQRVFETYSKLKGKLDNLEPQLCKASGYAFYNT